MYSSIVAAVDRSPRAAVLVASAATLATELDCGLEVVHVAQDDAPVAWLDDLVASSPWARTTSRVLTGEPAASLVALQDEHRASLLCLATRPHTALGGRLFGTTASNVLEVGTCSVLLVGPAARPLTGVRRILGCIEGTDDDRATVAPLAGMWAFRFHAALELVRGGRPTTAASPFDHGGDLAQAARLLRSGLGVRASWDVLHGPDAGAALVERAASQAADVVVVGHPDGPFDDVFLHVVQHSPASVLVAPSRRSVDGRTFGPTAARPLSAR